MYRAALLTIVVAYFAYLLVRLMETSCSRTHAANRSFGTARSFVTGASSGVGAALSEKLALTAPKLVLAGRDRGRLEAVQKRCAATETRILINDASDLDSMPGVAAQAIRAIRPDRRVFQQRRSLATLSAAYAFLSVHQELMQVDHFGPVALTLALLPELIKRKGAIVTTNSVSGKFGAPLRSSYSAAKHASKGFMDAVRLDLTNADTPISITNIMLGTTRTQIAANAVTLDAEGKPVKYADQNIAKGMDPAHVAELMLASCENALWEVWLVTPGVGPHCANQYVRPRRSWPAAKAIAQAATGESSDTILRTTTMSALRGVASVEQPAHRGVAGLWLPGIEARRLALTVAPLGRRLHPAARRPRRALPVAPRRRRRMRLQPRQPMSIAAAGARRRCASARPRCRAPSPRAASSPPQTGWRRVERRAAARHAAAARPRRRREPRRHGGLRGGGRRRQRRRAGRRAQIWARRRPARAQLGGRSSVHVLQHLRRSDEHALGLGDHARGGARLQHRADERLHRARCAGRARARPRGRQGGGGGGVAAGARGGAVGVLADTAAELGSR